MRIKFQLLSDHLVFGILTVFSFVVVFGLCSWQICWASRGMLQFSGTSLNAVQCSYHWFSVSLLSQSAVQYSVQPYFLLKLRLCKNTKHVAAPQLPVDKRLRLFSVVHSHWFEQSYLYISFNLFKCIHLCDVLIKTGNRNTYLVYF